MSELRKIMRLRRDLGKLLAVAAACLVFGLPAADGAEEPVEISAPRAASLLSGRSSIGLQEALILTMRHDPVLALAATDIGLGKGIASQATGLFDSTLIASASYEFSEGALPPSLFQQQVDRRELEREIIRIFGEIIADLEAQLASGQAGLVTCPEGLERLIIEGLGNICVQPQDQFTVNLLLGLEFPGIGPVAEELLANVRTRINNIVIPTLEDNIAAAQRRLDLLGVVPEREQQYSVNFSLGASRLFRSGTTLFAGLNVSGVEDNFKGKDYPAEFGGKGIPNTFRSFAGVLMAIPLGKNSGAQAVAAAEEAALLNQRASELRRIHALSTSSLQTTVAYWNAVAARERLRLLEDAVATQEGLYDVTRQLVAADEMPRSTLSQNEARLAAARRSVAAGKRALLSARLNLANSIGLAVEELDEAPGAAEGFPEVMTVEEIDELDAVALARRGVNARGDLRASRREQEATRVLADAARRNLRRTVNLGLSAGYSGLYESFSTEFYDPEGLWEALSGTDTGPSFGIVLDIEAPFANRVAIAELDQAETIDRQNKVRARDLERNVAVNVVDALAALRTAAAEVERREMAARLRETTLGHTLELFRAGEMSIIDTILSEEQVVFARLGVVDSKLAYARALARLKFEVADLVRYREEGDEVVVEDFLSGPLLSSETGA
jgi:outer membrane protein TolC